MTVIGLMLLLIVIFDIGYILGYRRGQKKIDEFKRSWPHQAGDSK